MKTAWRHPLEISIDELDMPMDTWKILYLANVKHIEMLCEMEDEAFWSIPNMNQHHHALIEKAVEKKLREYAPTLGLKTTAMHIAQYFIQLSEPNTSYYITPSKLQKLLYYAQGWHLALHGKVLFEEDIIARESGPVVLSVEKRFKRYGYHTLNPKQNYLIDEQTGKAYDCPTLEGYKEIIEAGIPQKETETENWKTFIRNIFKKL